MPLLTAVSLAESAGGICVRTHETVFLKLFLRYFQSSSEKVHLKIKNRIKKTTEYETQVPEIKNRQLHNCTPNNNNFNFNLETLICRYSDNYDTKYFI